MQKRKKNPKPQVESVQEAWQMKWSLQRHKKFILICSEREKKKIKQEGNKRRKLRRRRRKTTLDTSIINARVATRVVAWLRLMAKEIKSSKV